VIAGLGLIWMVLADPTGVIAKDAAALALRSSKSPGSGACGALSFSGINRQGKGRSWLTWPVSQRGRRAGDCARSEALAPPAAIALLRTARRVAASDCPPPSEALPRPGAGRAGAAGSISCEDYDGAKAAPKTCA
jgi:hypothetical protein